MSSQFAEALATAAMLSTVRLDCAAKRPGTTSKGGLPAGNGVRLNLIGGGTGMAMHVFLVGGSSEAMLLQRAQVQTLTADSATGFRLSCEDKLNGFGPRATCAKE